MLESIITTIDKFTPEILWMLCGLLFITSTIFLWIWFANRRNYNLLRHQLPATVVKGYLDSVITSSNTLKTALFRGDSVEVGGLKMPFPAPEIAQTLSVSGAGDAQLREQLQQKLAELASLQSQLQAALGVKKELEAGLAGAQARIKELEDLLAKKGAGGNEESQALSGELQKVTKERNDLREKLKEYEIIEDDLANLKRLQQENQQLKKALGVEAPAAAEAPPAPAAAEPEAAVAAPTDLFDNVERPSPVASATEELEEFLAEAPAAETQSTAQEKPIEEAPAKPAQNEKSAEDLLSEFEKMLG